MLHRTLSLLLIAAVAVPSTAQWNEITTSVNGMVRTMAEFNAQLFVGGNFTQVNGTSSYQTARYNGTTWSYVGTPLSGTGFQCLAVHNGTLFGGGSMLQGSTGPNGVAVWNGSSWQAGPYNVAATVNVNAMISFGGDLIVGGAFTDPQMRVARHNGTSYQAMGDGFNSTVTDFAVYNGQLYACGSMTLSGATVLGNIARWNGTAWENVGGGMNGLVLRMAVHQGALYAIGSFTTAGGTSASRIARWNGTAWSEVGGGLTIPLGASVQSLHSTAVGLLVGGYQMGGGGLSEQNLLLFTGSGFVSAGSLDPAERVLSMGTFQSQIYLGVDKPATALTGKVYKGTPVVGWEEVSPAPALTLFPNPARDQVQLAGVQDPNASYIVYDALGRHQLDGILRGPIHVGTLAPGTYWLRLLTEGRQVTLPLVLQWE